jgi:hypothetical protein
LFQVDSIEEDQMGKAAKKMRITEYRELADELGIIKSQLAPLLQREEELKEIFLDSGFQRIEGDFFCVNISRFPKVFLMMERVRSFLTPAQLAICEEVKPQSRVTCVAHKK